MLVRQKAILHLIDQLGGHTSRLRLVKLAFLLSRTVDSSKLRTFYQFVPYQYGPSSFALYHELESLIRNGYLVAPSLRSIRLGDDAAIPFVHPALTRQIAGLAAQYAKLATAGLLDLVYSGYPEFTVNAVPPERRLAERPRAKCAVYTTGYEGLQIDGFLNILVQKGIWQVIDVRGHPVSRRYGFHKSTLSRLCGRLDIEYRHVPELGIPSESRAALLRPSDNEQMLDDYENAILPAHKEAVSRIANWVRTQASVLVCMEADPRFCHRSRLAVQIAEMTGLAVHHLRGQTCTTTMPVPEFSSPS